MPADARPLRVGYLVPPSTQYAGIERVVREIASGLVETYGDLLEVHVVYCSREHDELAVRAPYRAHRLDVDRLLRLGPVLRRFLASHRLDILVTPQVEASVIAWLASRGRHMPVVVPHLHGNPRLEKDQGTRSTRVAFAVFRSVVARSVPLVLAVSPSLRDYASTTIARRSQVVFVRNPVRPLEVTVPPGVERREEDFAFVCVARLSEQKGQDLLLRALAVLRRHDLPTPVRLVLVGTGDTEDRLRLLARELGVEDGVDFAGYQPDPTAFLRAADCFVLASRWEGFGVALVEALQCGLPLVATDCEFGPADIIADDAIGELVPPEDVEALAGAMARAVARDTDPEAAAVRQRAARAYRRAPSVAMHYSILRSVGRH